MTNQRNPEESAQPINLELGSVPPRDWVERDVSKKAGAYWIAKALVVIFGVFLGLTVLGGFAIVLFRSPDDAMKLIKDAMVPLLESVGKVASTVFAPLLAFVLGHYFGKESSE